MDFNISVYDESLSLYGALRVFHGQLPYRDFWTMYPPGEFYALALAFRLFGVLAIWDRAIFIAANALTAIAILYILSRITGRPWLSRFATFATLLWLSARPSYAFPIYPSLTFILIATACMLRRWRDGNTRPVLWAGAALGVSAVFRHDLALYALISLSLASIIHQLDFPRPRREHVWTPLRLSLAALLIVSPVLILLLIRVPSHDLYYDLLYVPGVIYPKVRSLPFPNLAQILHGFRHPYALNPPMQGDIEYNIVWLPPLVVLASLIMLLENRRHRTLPAWTATNLVCLTLLTALLFLKGFVRVSPLHMVPGIVPALILLACLVARLPAMGRPLALPYCSLLLGRCPVFLRRRIMTTSYFVRTCVRFGERNRTNPLRRSLSSARRPISCPLPLPSAGRTAGHPISSVPDQTTGTHLCRCATL